MSSKDTLTGRRPSETYPGLMKLGSVYMNGTTSSGDLDVTYARLDENARSIQDGEGRDTPIWLSASKVWLHGSEFTAPTTNKQFLQYEEVTGTNGAATSKKMRWMNLSAISSYDITEDPRKKFWSQGLFDSAFAVKTTDQLTQGSVNKYFSNTLARNAISSAGGKLNYDKNTGILSISQYYTADVIESTNLYYTQARFDSAFNLKNTNDLKEGSNNLYFTTARARDSISVSGGGTYNSTTGIITIPVTSASSSSIAGGAATQIPYQSAVSVTAFSSAFRWDNASKTFTIGDGTNAGTISGVGGSSSQTTMTVQSGNSIYGSDLVLNAGSATNGVGGSVHINAASSTIAGGGDVIVSAGTGTVGGAVIIQTGQSTAAEKFRITPAGAWALGGSPTATGSVNQYLSSSGTSSSPVWKTLPTRVNNSNYSDSLTGGVAGQMPYQSAPSATLFSDLYWDPAGSLTIKSNSASLIGQGALSITTSPAASTGSITIQSGVPTGTTSGGVLLKTTAATSGGDVKISTDSRDVITVTNAGVLRLNGAVGLANQVAMVDTDGITKYKSITSNMVAENTNLYWTQARFDAAFAAKSTTNLKEGTNLYWTQARFDTGVAALTTSDIAEGSRLYYTQARFDSAFTAKSTTNLKEGTNLYYTAARARSALNTSGNILVYDAVNGALSTDIDTSKVPEFNNLYFTTARARGSITTGGNILSYNSGTGVMSTNIDTSKVPENTNLYYTDARARASTTVSGNILSYNSGTGVLGTNIDTSKVPELTNLYYTDARARNALVVSGNILSYNSSTGTLSTAIDTTKVPEGTNQYFTQARVRTAISVSGDLAYNSSTGVISYSAPSGVLGAVPFVSENGTSKYTTGSLVNIGPFVASDAELAFAQNQVTPQSEIINTWKRISHSGATQPAVPAELNAWEYIAADGVFRNTTNSTSIIGLVSNTSYGDYDHEVMVYSTDSDDDTIGLIAAFTVVNGVEYTIMAFRTCGGNGRPWQIRYNHGLAGAKDLAPTMNAIKWSNGNYGMTNTEAGYTGSPGWAAAPASGGTKIKITRRGNIFKFITTDMGSPDYVAASEVTIDLNADAALRKFIGNTQIGFMSNSQRYSYWKQLNFVNYAPIYDVRTGVKWTSDGTTWSSSAAAADNVFTQVGVGRILYDQVSDSIYYTESYGKVVKIKQGKNDIVPQASPILILKEETTIAANANKSYAAATILGANASKYDLTTIVADVWVKDTVSTSPTFNYYVPSVAAAAVGIKTTGEVIVQNMYSAAATFLVRLSANKIAA